MSENMDRRAFLRNATIGAAAIAGAGVLASCASGGGAASASAAEASASAADAASEAPAAAPANRVCEILGIEKPVIGAPMNSLTNAEWIAAIAEAGGIAILNTTTLTLEGPQISGEEILRLATEEVEKIVELTDKPFGLVTPYRDDVPGMKDLILQYKPKLVIPYNLSQDDIYDLRDEGIVTIGQSGDADIEVVKQTAQDNDILYLKCYGCGGSIPKSRANATAIMQKLAGAGIETPIVIGGGIVNAAGAAATAALGADGLFVGTRFLATEESPMHPDVKQALIEMKAAEMLEVDLGYAWNHTNDHPKAREIIKRGLDGEDLAAIASEADHTYLQCMRLGDMENWYISVDDSIDAITEITTCKQVVDELGDAFLEAQAKMA